MHFLETYALNSGLKIDKPFIFEKYYPIEFDDYIVFSFKNYEYFQDVIDIIKPHLKGTEIIHLKRQASEFADCHEIKGIDFNQAAYLIGRSKLYFGEPSIYTDLASHYGVNTVTIYSNTFPQNAFPYWKSKDYAISIGGNSKPFFGSEQSLGALNSIKPEEIAQKILNALGAEYKTDHETVFIGSLYQRNDIIAEIVPDNNQPVLMDNLNCSVRMDLKFNEEYLYNILKLRPLQIWTKTPIHEKILTEHKDNIQQIFYIITENDNPEFPRLLKNLSIKTKLVTYLSEQELNKKKLNYIDYDPIFDLNQEKTRLNNSSINNLFYSSCKVLYENDAYYASDYARSIKLEIEDSFEENKFEKNELLLKDLRYFKIVSKQG
jgi:hypothetical protein